MKYYYFPSSYVGRGRGRGGKLFRNTTKPAAVEEAPPSIQRKIIQAETTGQPVEIPKKELSLWQKTKNLAKGIGRFAMKAVPIALTGIGMYNAFRSPTGLLQPMTNLVSDGVDTFVNMHDPTGFASKGLHSVYDMIKRKRAQYKMNRLLKNHKFPELYPRELGYEETRLVPYYQ